MFETFFRLKENHTTVMTEVLAGITTFMTMAYILAVNPAILGDAGMDRGAVFTATALAAAIGTVCMALFTNYPFALAPGMGLNAYFAYTVVGSMGYGWQTGLAAVFIEGILFIILSAFNIREAIFNAIPANLKEAVSVGIGLFIAFIGLQNSRIVIKGNNLLELFSIEGYNRAYNVEASFKNVGITVLLAMIGILVTAVLITKKVKGNILWGILITWFLGMLCELTGIYVPDPELGCSSLFPDALGSFLIPDIRPVFFKMDFRSVFSLNFVVVIFAFLFVDLFDTLGTLMGVSVKAGMLDEHGRLEHVKGALMADAVGTGVGALLGTSTVSTYVESAAGVAEGGRTGLTGLTTAFLFILSLFFAPVFLAIPSFAAAPALIMVGFYMMANVVNIDFKDLAEAIPCYICIIAMPFFYSISEGIVMGIISYVVIHLLTGRLKEKKISMIMYICVILFIVKYIVL